LGFSQVFLYGGEPFLRIHDTLPYAIEMTYNMDYFLLSERMDFGEKQKKWHRIFRVIDAIAAQYDRIFPISLSVDEYHEKFVPPESIARIIKEVRFGHYDHIRLKIQTLTSPSSFEALERLYDACMEVGIELIKTDRSGVYPTLPQEFIEVIPENNPQIANLLNCPEDRIEELVALKSSTEDERLSLRCAMTEMDMSADILFFLSKNISFRYILIQLLMPEELRFQEHHLNLDLKMPQKGSYIYCPKCSCIRLSGASSGSNGAVLYIDNLKGTISWVRGKLEELGIG